MDDDFTLSLVAVSLWVWIGSLLAASTLLGVGAVLLQSRWARHSGLAVSWLVATVVLVVIAAVALGWVGGAGQGGTLLSEYAQEAPFAIDTVLAFTLILRRYLPNGAPATHARIWTRPHASTPAPPHRAAANAPEARR